MKKSIACLLLVALLALSACTPAAPAQPESRAPSPGSPVLPQIPQDYFTVLCENTDVEIFGDASYYQAVEYPIISAVPLDGQEVHVQFDRDVAFQCSIVMDAEPWKLDETTFNVYQQAPPDANVGFFDIPAESLPVLYRGILHIGFDASAFANDITLTELSVTVGSKTQTYAIGKLRLRSGFWEGRQRSNALCVEDVAATGMNIAPSVEGNFELPTIRVSISEDVAIERISFLEEGPEISEISYSQTLPDGMTVNGVWDGTAPLALPAGMTVTFAVKGTDPGLKSQMNGARGWHLLFDYTYQGAQYTDFCQLLFRMLPNPFHYYAIRVDGLDFADFYAAQ